MQRSRDGRIIPSAAAKRIATFVRFLPPVHGPWAAAHFLEWGVTERGRSLAQPQRKAVFFVTPDGVVIPKAQPLKHAQRMAVFVRDGEVCQKCSASVSFFVPRNWPYNWDKKQPGQIDHIFPRSRGGQNDNGNLRLLCRTCNSQKGSK